MTATLDDLVALQLSGHIPENVNFTMKIEYALPIIYSAQIGPSERAISSNHMPALIKVVEESVVLIIAR